MRILFIVENACKRNDSNSNIANLMMEYLKKDHQIFLLTRNTTRNPKLKKAKKGGVIYYFYQTAYEKQIKKLEERDSELVEFESDKKKYFIRHPLFAIKRLVYSLHAKDNFKTMISGKIEKICAAYKIDAVVAVALPYHTAMALADAKVAAKKVVYQLDPYSDNYYFKDNPKTLEIEKDVLKKVDRVIT